MLSENIKNLRKEKGMSQEELAAKLNVVRQTVSKWEQNLSVPDSEMLIKIAEVFEVPVSQLLGETVDVKDTKSELAEISQKLENLNSFIAEKYARRRRICLTVVAVCLIILAVILMIFGFIISQRISFSPSSTVGIIGGADGPTQILVASSGSWIDSVLVFAASVVLIITSVIILKRMKK